MVGDTAGDVAAGKAEGCRTILLGDAPGELAITGRPTSVMRLAGFIEQSIE